MKIDIGPYLSVEEENAGQQRKEIIEIHDYDVWNLDNTLAKIIVPALKLFKETTIGYPGDLYQDCYGPQMCFTGEGFDHDDKDTDGMENWHVILDKMIWAFEQCLVDYEGDYIIFEDDISDASDKSSLVKIDNNGLREHQEKMQEGFALFAKYFTALWD